MIKPLRFTNKLILRDYIFALTTPFTFSIMVHLGLSMGLYICKQINVEVNNQTSSQVEMVNTSGRKLSGQGILLFVILISLRLHRGAYIIITQNNHQKLKSLVVVTNIVIYVSLKKSVSSEIKVQKLTQQKNHITLIEKENKCCKIPQLLYKLVDYKQHICKNKSTTLLSINRDCSTIVTYSKSVPLNNIYI